MPQAIPHSQNGAQPPKPVCQQVEGGLRTIQVTAGPRGKPGASQGGFCWQSKFIIRHIADIAEADRRVSPAAAIAAYTALTVLVSDRGNRPTIQVPLSDITKICGNVANTTAKALTLIQEAGFIRITENHFPGTTLKASNSYTLLNHEVSLCNHCRSINNQPETGAVEDLCEETKEKSKNPKERALPQAAAPLEELPSRWLEMAQEEFPTRADVAKIARKFAGKYPAGHRKRTYETLLHWLRIELSPIFREPVHRGYLPEPAGWKVALRAMFPAGTNSTADRCITMEWSELPAEYQVQFTADVQKLASGALPPAPSVAGVTQGILG